MKENYSGKSGDGYKLCYVLYDGSHPENFCRNAAPFYGEFTNRDTWIQRVCGHPEDPKSEIEPYEPIAAWITPLDCCLVHPGQYVGNSGIKDLVLPDNHMPIEWFRKLVGVRVTDDGCVFFRDDDALASIQTLAAEFRGGRFSDLKVSLRGEKQEPWLSGEVDQETVVSERITMEEYQGVKSRTTNIDSLAFKYFGLYLESPSRTVNSLVY